jgi:hypothetical protein
MKKTLSIGGHDFHVRPFNALDKKQVYQDFTPAFEKIIVLLSEYQSFNPINQYGTAEYTRQSRNCIKQINKLKNRFDDGLTYLTDDQMPLFRFFVARELFEIGYSFEENMSKHIATFDRYHKFSTAYLLRFNDLVFTAISEKAYGEYGEEHPWRAA